MLQSRENIRTHYPTDVVTANSDYMVQRHEATVLCDASRRGVTVTLPRAVNHSGRTLSVKKSDATTTPVLLKTYPGETIGSYAILPLQTADAAVVVQSDGKRWFIMSQNSA